MLGFYAEEDPENDGPCVSYHKSPLAEWEFVRNSKIEVHIPSPLIWTFVEFSVCLKQGKLNDIPQCSTSENDGVQTP